MNQQNNLSSNYAVDEKLGECPLFCCDDGKPGINTYCCTDHEPYSYCPLTSCKSDSECIEDAYCCIISCS